MSALLRRLLLLLYSLSPGIAKLSGIDAMFGVGLLLLALYFALLKPVGDRGPVSQIGIRAMLLVFVGYALALGSLLWLVGMAHEWTLVVGLISFVVPLAFAAVAGPGRCARLLDDLPLVAAFHAIVALAIYPPLRADIAWLNSAADALLEGTLAFRLATVSGSLALSSVMVVAFALTLRQHLSSAPGSAVSRLTWCGASLFLLCTLLSLQRAAWVALLLIVVVAVITAPSGRRRSLGVMLAITFAPLLVVLSTVDLPEGALDVVLERLDTVLGQGEVGAVAERSDQWGHVAHNFVNLPIGYGPGQLGQAARDVRPREGGLPIFDGDYFRIVSEYGVAGVALVVLILASLAAALRKLYRALQRRDARGDSLLSAAALGLMLQGIGTNVTELYFANTLFWSLLLLQWHAPLPTRRAATGAQPVQVA